MSVDRIIEGDVKFLTQIDNAIEQYGFGTAMGALKTLTQTPATDDSQVCAHVGCRYVVLRSCRWNSYSQRQMSMRGCKPRLGKEVSYHSSFMFLLLLLLFECLLWPLSHQNINDTPNRSQRMSPRSRSCWPICTASLKTRWAHYSLSS